jgi:S-methylmethionine-dependent homocysteine/selenocysteine methylase
MGWIDAGATLVGGCCHTRPAHLAEVRRRLSDR